jgi:hypothetical protein
LGGVDRRERFVGGASSSIEGVCGFAMLGIPNVGAPNEEIARALANGITAPSRLSGAAIPACPRVGEPTLSCGCDVFDGISRDCLVQTHRHYARHVAS